MHRHHNGVRTAVLLGALSALILLVGRAVGGATGLTAAVLVALATNGVAYFASATIALRSVRARPVSEFEAPGLYRVVRELSTAARRPMPRLYVAPTAAPNAFATGRNPRHAAVCVTEGILGLLDERELRGVIGHELSHVYNRDILLSSVAAGLASVVVWLAHLAWLVPLGGDDDDEGVNPLGMLLLLVLGPVAATLVRLGVSRAREFQADASGAAVTGDPLALASALRKIEAGVRRLPLVPEPRLRTTSALMIANPFRADGPARLFSTHPPTEERVARLLEIAGHQR
ncbi:zinc metalloprotease HtpX [Motilibacter aurantiacus]|uniref:zinc metalloprotease HtpX n=1 Tax=Motilibacter aurantiacus TaxID=2714955 RepID=UPI00140A94EC|nr:zinc metalloprotease HtpX [Motilibacter aurantiacus]